MNATDSIFHRAVSKLLIEIFNGPPTADWNASWQRNTVTEEQWRTLRQKLRQAADQWRSAADKIQTWDDTKAAGALSTIAHTAYHLGAIRQILAVVKK